MTLFKDDKENICQSTWNCLRRMTEPLLSISQGVLVVAKGFLYNILWRHVITSHSCLFHFADVWSSSCWLCLLCLKRQMTAQGYHRHPESYTPHNSRRQTALWMQVNIFHPFQAWWWHHFLLLQVQTWGENMLILICYTQTSLFTHAGSGLLHFDLFELWLDGHIDLSISSITAAFRCPRLFFPY